MEKVAVLMSTYNGEKFLREQLNSLLNQQLSSDIYMQIYIRDDGSTDSTPNILREYDKEFSNITVFCDKLNIGWKKSFLKICKEVDDADYYAFCDQDDVWNEMKIQAAIDELRKWKTPCLYYCKAEMVDERLNHIGYYKIDKTYSLEKTLVKCRMIGCTQVFNKQLWNYICRLDYNNEFPHDWWTFLVAELFGNIIYNDKAYIKYRQQENNVFGGRQKIFLRLKKIFNSNDNIREKISIELKKLYPEKINSYINDVSRYRTSKTIKLKIIFKRYHIGFIRKIFFKLFIILNKF